MNMYVQICQMYIQSKQGTSTSNYYFYKECLDDTSNFEEITGETDITYFIKNVEKEMKVISYGIQMN